MKLLTAVLTFLLLSVGVGALVPPSPFPVVAEVLMGGGVVAGQTITVRLVDGEVGSVITAASFVTGSDGRVLFDLGNLKDCSVQYRNDEGSCFAGGSRNYVGDNVEFVTVWQGQTYKVVKSVESLRLEIGVPVSDKFVRLEDVSAPPQVIEVEKEVVVKEEVVVEKEVFIEGPTTVLVVCEDGSEVELPEDCPGGISGVSDVVFYTLIALAGVVLTALGVSWGKGYLALAKYWWKKGEKLRALRMLLTVVKKAKEEYYKKK